VETLKDAVSRANSEKEQLLFDLEKQKLGRTLAADQQEELQ